jgi:Zn-dependent protease
MIRFSIFGFPVTVQWLFWVVLAVLGPINALGQPGGLMRLGLWVGIGFVSILWHELGHCFFQRKYGATPEIQLYGGGGLAIAHGGRFTRAQSLIVAAAGPAFGLMLWAVSERFFHHFPPKSPALVRASLYLWQINLFWSLINLLPVLPLDGGRILEAIVNGRIRIVAGIGVVVAAAAAIWAFFNWGLYTAVLFGFFAVQNFQLLQSPGLPPPPPR